MQFAGNRMEGEKWEEALLYAIASNGDLFGTGMTTYNEKMLYKKFLKVVEIPPIAKLDAELMFDLKFYSRFLAMHVAKMKKDWVKIDEDMNGRGMKRAQVDYEMKNIQRWSQDVEKRKRHLEKHPEDDDQAIYDKCETCAEVYKEKVLKKAKRRRKKRYRKLWSNSVPLVRYKGCLFINHEMVSERREKRYQEEKLLYEYFVISRKEKKTTQATFKEASLKAYYGKMS
jgi:hypothetical protein